MNPDQLPNAERFFEALAGREAGLEGAEHLRTAILAEEGTLREAETATANEIPAEEIRRLNEVKAQLLASGIFSAMPTVDPAHKDNSTARNASGFLAWLKDMLAAHRLAPLAVAATVILAVLVSLQFQQEATTDLNEADVVRGGEALVLRVENPAQTVAQIKHSLEPRGVEVIAVQLNERMWAVQLNPSDQAHKKQTTETLAELGIKADGDWPFSFRVSAK